jgi:hypothetical protein
LNPIPLPTEIAGLIILGAAGAAKFLLPGVPDFWLAVIASIALFLLMYIRTARL